MKEILIVVGCMCVGWLAALALYESRRPAAVWALRPDVLEVVQSDRTKR